MSASGPSGPLVEVCCRLKNQIRNDISCKLSPVRSFICNIKVYLLPEIQESTVQFVIIGVLRVKIKAVFISKPFQTPDKKLFDTDVI